jgi:hypothetical protein
MDAGRTAAPPLAAAPYDRSRLQHRLTAAVTTFRCGPADQRRLLRAGDALADLLDACAGATLQERWDAFERDVWARWVTGQHRPSGARWTWGVRAIVTARLVQPSWTLLTQVRIAQWLARLPVDDPCLQQRDRLAQTLAAITWASAVSRAEALTTGLRLLLAHGYTALEQITETDCAAIPAGTQGLDLLDAAFCTLGVFPRTPQRGTSRRRRRGRRTPAELVTRSDIPDRFRPVTILYLETYAARISAVQPTLRHKVRALGHFWRFLDEQYPEIQGCADIQPVHARAFIPHALERARRVRRNGSTDPGDRATAHAWLTDVRTFFADLCTWATEPGSP